MTETAHAAEAETAYEQLVQRNAELEVEKAELGRLVDELEEQNAALRQGKPLGPVVGAWALHLVTRERDDLATYAERLSELLERSLIGLKWYRDTHPESDSGTDDEHFAEAEAVLAETPATSLTHRETHPDDQAVDRFATAMKAKLADAREKGRDGWDDPDRCSVKLLTDLLLEHMEKGNDGNYVDIANLAMMLHLRLASPDLLAREFARLIAENQIQALEMVRRQWHEPRRYAADLDDFVLAEIDRLSHQAEEPPCEP